MCLEMIDSFGYIAIFLLLGLEIALCWQKIVKTIMRSFSKLGFKAIQSTFFSILFFVPFKLILIFSL